ncbi:glycoside hydrolase family 2 TIM barrel-domain containing protein [Paenibacillus sp. LHD-38]|uniref:glycoside hydrolase family 2 TIM barrel-domain containing protein n=1 Tax=Paenibacillus sp. LHD-38 TaxID=3072143 RepID=UPI00280C7279|nr:glycoside hydrolase family 2 TIM barrel-domain containing protein [Paenibacillus sp. LHD-38]MDQ8734267.1 glycoside hydrolase family 2 TIM barrel-domain containing protein [Paenibacillus sp. LHD-38]
MLRKSFNEKWSFSKGTISFSLSRSAPEMEITLPHDAMVLEERDQDCGNQHNTGYFPGGNYTYKKKWYAPKECENKNIVLEFEGVYMNAMVYINGDFAGKCPYGYSNFYVKANRFLKWGADNEIKVLVKNGAEPNSRWYTGSGIYRNVNMMIGELLHIKEDGVRITTPDIAEDQAVVETSTVVRYDGIATQKAYVLTEIKDADGSIVASDKTPLTIFSGESVTVRQRLYVQEPKLWSVDEPNLYYCYSKILVDDKVVDEDRNHFGIRKLQLDTQHGLRINGEVVKLRGACIHHDNGVIGACTLERAEERRVEILKEAGFNAIRSAHQPISKAMLDACDRLGMLVMDETFDMWNSCQTEYDYGLYFQEWWERDVQAMIDKDYNHPSVIMYSIGNEIREVATGDGASMNRQIAEKLRSLDGTRFITSSVNGWLCIMDRLGEIMASFAGENKEAAASAEQPDSNEINTVMTTLMGKMNQIVKHESVGAVTEEAFAAVDFAGYNYMNGRYEMDKELYPNRIICGTETMPNDIDINWRMTKANSHIIGDFVWTGWDYLGEAGIGKIDYTLDESKAIYGPYPWYVAYCGDIDIIGNRRPASYYREIVWGLRNEPYIAVQRPQHYNQKFMKSAWSWSDSISSWTWPGSEDNAVKVEVYSDAEEVELLLNGDSIGKAAVGEANRFKAIFDTVYMPGELTAVAYVDGEETGRMVLKTAGTGLELKLENDRDELRASGADLAHIMISFTDENGVLQTAEDRKVSITVEGPGTLQGFGSANPKSQENFYDTERTTFDGKVLAVVRSIMEAGTITVTASAEGCAPKSIMIQVL